MFPVKYPRVLLFRRDGNTGILVSTFLSLASNYGFGQLICFFRNTVHNYGFGQLICFFRNTVHLASILEFLKYTCLTFHRIVFDPSSTISTVLVRSVYLIILLLLVRYDALLFAGSLVSC